MDHIEEKFLEHIKARGTYESLFQLAVVEVGVSYSWGWNCLQRLERLGFVTVERRGPGYPLKMRIAAEWVTQLTRWSGDEKRETSMSVVKEPGRKTNQFA